MQMENPFSSDFLEYLSFSNKLRLSLESPARLGIMQFMIFMLTLADISGDTWSEDIVEQRKVLGRAATAEIRLDHSSVSRQHCAFWYEDDACWVQDCGSTNGTYVNGIKVSKEKIRPGDTIVVGRFELVVEDKERVLATLDLPPT